MGVTSGSDFSPSLTPLVVLDGVAVRAGADRDGVDCGAGAGDCWIKVESIKAPILYCGH